MEFVVVVFFFVGVVIGLLTREREERKPDSVWFGEITTGPTAAEVPVSINAAHASQGR